MTVYFIAQIEIEEPEQYQKYVDGFFPVFKKYNGEFLVSDSNTEILEGEWAYSRTVLMKFEKEEDARNWYQSKEYQDLKEYRHGSAKANLVMVKN